MTSYPPPPDQDPNQPSGQPGDSSGAGYPPPAGGYPPPTSSYPPPSGGYPPPQGGSYPPPAGFPPPPNFPPHGQDSYANPYAQQAAGGYPTSPGQPGYGGAPQLSVGAALTYGWEKYKANVGSWIGMSILAVVITVVVQLLFSFVNSTAVSLLGSLISFVVGVLLQAAFTRGALSELDGERPAVGTFFQFKNLGAVFLVVIAVSVITTIGFILLIIPGIALTYLTWYSLTFAIDRDLGVVDAVKSSFRLTTENAGQLLVLALACVAINIVGALLCLLGLLVTAPVALIAATYAYRVITGGAVSPTA